MIGQDIQSAAGPIQTCAGHEAGCEAVVHAMKEMQALDETEALLLVDAENSFNIIERQLCIISGLYVRVYQLCLTTHTANQYVYLLMEEQRFRPQRV